MNTTKTVISVDTSKRVFQLYWAESETGECMGMKLTRAKLLEHFANRAPCLVAMEACGGSQHWARQLVELGHEVRLIPAKKVRPFVGGNESDAHDARAIWTTVQQPGLRTVAIKSEEQQAILALHRMRAQLVKFRTAQINALRGLLAEYGGRVGGGRIDVSQRTRAGSVGWCRAPTALHRRAHGATRDQQAGGAVASAAQRRRRRQPEPRQQRPLWRRWLPRPRGRSWQGEP